MKKFSRIFALILTLAVMFSALAITASAAATDCTISIGVSKVVNGEKGAALPNETFTFTLTPAGAETAEGVKAGVPVTSNTATVEVKNSDVLTGDSLDFNTTINAKATFDAPGIYHYTLTETAGDTSFITYGKEEYDVYVYVSFVDGSSELEIVSVQPYVRKTTDGSDANKTKMNPQFVNAVDNTEMKVTKTVTGNLGDRQKSFNFTLKTEPNAKYSAGIKFPVVITRANGSTEKAEVVLGTDFAFSLAHGESLDVSLLPISVECEVIEADYSALDNGNGGYTTKVNGTAGREYSTTLTADSAEANFVNDKTVTTTGVFMNYAPYIAIMAVAMIAGVAFILSKKRRASEG